MNPVKYRQLTILADMASQYEDYYIDIADYYEEKCYEALKLEELRRLWDDT